MYEPQRRNELMTITGTAVTYARRDLGGRTSQLHKQTTAGFASVHSPLCSELAATNQVITVLTSSGSTPRTWRSQQRVAATKVVLQSRTGIKTTPLHVNQSLAQSICHTRCTGPDYPLMLALCRPCYCFFPKQYQQRSQLCASERSFSILVLFVYRQARTHYYYITSERNRSNAVRLFTAVVRYAEGSE